MPLIEIVGYIGSALVLISFLMTSVVRLRLVNMAGGIISGIYALIIGSYPLALMNFCLVLINARFLWKMKTTEREYELIEVAPSDAFLGHLLARWGDDIRSIFPGASTDQADYEKAYIVTYEDAPVSFSLGRLTEADTLTLSLDYAMPAYRDFSIGRYLFSELGKTGLKRVIYDGPTENHTEYLKAMGFEEHHGKWGKGL